MNLTQAAQYTKRIMIFSVIFVVLVILGFMAYGAWKSYYIAHLPKPVIKPEQKFGPLPNIDFPKSKADAASFSFTIDTTTGDLPSFEGFIKVYFIPSPVVTLLSSDRSKEQASRFGIKSPPAILSDTKYSFSEGTKSLSMDIASTNLKYTNPSSPSADAKLTTNENNIADSFRNILNNLFLMKPDLGQGSPFKIQYFKFGNPITQVASPDNADMARVSIWPTKIEDKPILTADANISLVNGIFHTAPNNLANYIEINYTYWSVDLQTSSTYYLKPAKAAYEELKSGSGTIIQPPSTNTVSITNVYLAYFLPTNHADYLQPIYVFSGPGFIGYVSAIGQEPAASPAQ